MHFEPGHPVMLRCLEQTMKLGRAVKWGDTGPRMLTRVLEEYGLPRAGCPSFGLLSIHYSQALDALRPRKRPSWRPGSKSSLFLHVWNSMLVHCGVHKACLAPKGSVLRALMDKHPVDGWIGEYDGGTLEGALGLKADLNASAEENRRLQDALELQAAEGERAGPNLKSSRPDNWPRSKTERAAAQRTRRHAGIDQLAPDGTGTRK